jgi:hypothetical protein
MGKVNSEYQQRIQRSAPILCCLYNYYNIACIPSIYLFLYEEHVYCSSNRSHYIILLPAQFVYYCIGRGVDLWIIC